MMNRHEPPPRKLWPVAAVFVLINLVAKGAFLGINAGEYTDGILQLQAWENRAGFYPPLYEGMARLVSGFGVSLESAARLVSLVAASLCVVPVFFMAVRLGGTRAAAVFAALLYTLSPMPWRWSVRVMTDSLFLLLSTGSVAMLACAWAGMRGDSAKKPATGVDWKLTGAVVFAGLAGLTRYHGALLAPLLAMVFIFYVARYRRVPWAAAGAALVFAAVAAWWLSVNRQIHAGQFASRTAGTPWQTAFAWINNLESFILISPYYFGYPVFVAAVVGALVVRRTSVYWYARPAAVVWVGYAVLLLGLQAAFGSFQYRYMMPLLPVVCALAGVGVAVVEQWSMTADARPALAPKFRRALFRGVFLLSILYLACLSFAVLVLQRGTFGDQREAAEFLRGNVPATTPVYANERYGPHLHLGSVKLSFWSGRPVQVLATPADAMPAGALLVLGTAYGGDEAVGRLLEVLRQRYTLRPLTPEPFRSEIVPLMDDIMTDPMFNQNPLAWVMRYVPQYFATQIFEVQPLEQAGDPGGA